VCACDEFLRNDVRILGYFDEETRHGLRFALIIAVDLRGNQSFVYLNSPSCVVVVQLNINERLC
jgi:hypothetical protein